MKNSILQQIPTECSWRDTLYWYDTIDSTNTRAKTLAKEGAAHGTVVVAGQQTGGRGRMGRSFQSPAGEGAYLSVILRPNCPPAQLMHLTCAVGVAMLDAIQHTAGIHAELKWINDLVWQKKKLGGILTELAMNPKTGLVEYAVVGVGINCQQHASGFPPEIQEIATSLSIAAGHSVSTASVIAQMILALYRMTPHLLTKKRQIMDTYRNHCVTLGQTVMVLQGDMQYPGQAVDIEDDGGLIIALPDGSKQTVHSGEVSVRGFYGYV